MIDKHDIGLRVYQMDSRPLSWIYIAERAQQTAAVSINGSEAILNAMSTFGKAPSATCQTPAMCLTLPKHHALLELALCPNNESETACGKLEPLRQAWT